mgnify:CR=1 FL=1
MTVVAKEEINPAVPDKGRVLVRLAKGGRNWYIRLRQHGRYRCVSLGTSDLTEARRKAFLDPPEANEKQARTIRRALLDFQESRQQLMDAPAETKNIRPNTFKTYKARVQALINFFDYLQVANKLSKVKTVGSLTGSDFATYRHWREKQGKMLTTIKTEIHQINTILSWLTDNGYLPRLIKVPLPQVNTNKYRQPNRLLTEQEELVMKSVLKQLCACGDPEKEMRWRLYALWLEWLEDTFTRPHECRLLRFTDVREQRSDGKTAVQFYTKAETKTGERLVYATSKVKSKLLRLYESWCLPITPSSHLFLLPKGTPPSATWYSDMWKKLMSECGFKVKPRELTQYSLRHQGINNLLVQGVPPTKVADLAGHSLSIQQRIYKKYSLEDDHSVLLDATKKKKKRSSILTSDSDIPFPWEVDAQTGQWFPEEES